MGVCLRVHHPCASVCVGLHVHVSLCVTAKFAVVGFTGVQSMGETTRTGHHITEQERRGDTSDYVSEEDRRLRGVEGATHGVGAMNINEHGRGTTRETGHVEEHGRATTREKAHGLKEVSCLLELPCISTASCP